MNAEENAFLANIVTILVKDIGIDKQLLAQKPSNVHNSMFKLDEDENDDEADVFIYKRKIKLKRKFILKKNLQRKAIQTMFNSILKLPNTFSDEEFQENLCITKRTFKKLCAELRYYLQKNVKLGDCFITQDLILYSGLIFLLSDKEILQTNLKFYKINANLFYKLVPLFYENIAKNYQVFVKWPEIDALGENSHKKNLENLFGIISSNIVNINLKSGQHDTSTAIALQMTINTKKYITSLEILNANSYNFATTKIGNLILNDNQNTCIPKDEFLIGSNCFPLSSKIITPFSKDINERKQAFNKLLNDYINLADNIFQEIFQLFNLLFNFSVRNIQQFENVLKTICVVYNICLFNNDSFNLKPQKLNIDRPKSINDEDDMNGLITRQKLMDSII